MKSNLILACLFLCMSIFSCQKEARDTIISTKGLRAKVRTSNFTRTEYHYNGDKIAQIVQTRGESKDYRQDWKYNGDTTTIEFFKSDENDEWMYEKSLVIVHNKGKISRSSYIKPGSVTYNSFFTWNGELLDKVEEYASDTLYGIINYYYSGTLLDSVVCFNSPGNKQFQHEYSYTGERVSQIKISNFGLYGLGLSGKVEIEYSHGRLSIAKKFDYIITGEWKPSDIESWNYDYENKTITHNWDILIEYEEGESNITDLTTVTKGWQVTYLSDPVNESFLIK